MRNQLGHLILTIITSLLINSCGQESSNSSRGVSNTTSSPVATTTSSNTPVTSTGGPTGTVTPVTVTPTPTGTTTYYTTPVPTPVAPDYGTAINTCGTLYRVLNGSNAIFKTTAGVIYTAKYISYETDLLLRSLLFPNDSYSVCIEGFEQNISGVKTLNMNSYSSLSPVSNPSRTNTSLYNYEVCGNLVLRTDHSGRTYWEITNHLNVAYWIENPQNLRTANLQGQSVKGCAYSSSPHRYNYDITYKRIFTAQAIDVGIYNIN